MAKTSQKKQKTNDNNNNNSNNIIINNSSSSITKISPSKGKRTRKSVPRQSPSQRSSIYRGVTRHRWTGRYEAHLWDKNCWMDTQKKKKGRQVYLGAYDDEAAAARAYDLAALKYWGNETQLNFPLGTYENDMKEMEALSREEYIGSIRRKSSGFSRGVSKYRGVARHHHNGRWEARIGRVLGNKYLYLGTYATEEEAATAYDIAAIEHRGLNAVTNFDLSRYIQWLKPNDQPSPNNSIEATTKLMDISASNTSSPLSFLDHQFDEIHDQIESVITVDEAIWGHVPAIDCSSTLLGLNGFNSSTNHDLYAYVEGQGSSSNDIGENNDEDFFSDLNSFLCDFDIIEDEQMSL